MEKEFDDWRARYDAAVRAYEAKAARRRARKRRSAERDGHAAGDGPARRPTRQERIDAFFADTPPPGDPVERYFWNRGRTGRVLLQLLGWSVCTAGNAAWAVLAPWLIRTFATQTVNHVEKLLWREQKRAHEGEAPDDAARRERRKIRRRTTLSAQPKPDDMRRGWLKASGTCRGIIAFGALVHDLECFVDNALRFDAYGNVAGRAAGILGWLRLNVPELAPRYKTVMRYKAIAKRARQYLKLRDPRPLDPDAPALIRLLRGCPATQKDVQKRLDAALARRWSDRTRA